MLNSLGCFLLLRVVGPRGEVLGNLREPGRVLGKTREYWGLLGYLPALNYLPVTTFKIYFLLWRLKV